MVQEDARLLENHRLAVARRVRELRVDRRWTQAELAARLGLSQSRLSELERGAGSFTAEQLLVVLQLFNVPVADFAARTRVDPHAALQNELARLGARHLVEVEHAAPSDRGAGELDAIIRDALDTGQPRLITALAPVIVSRVGETPVGPAQAWSELGSRLARVPRPRRAGWLVDNIVAALRLALAQPLPREWTRRYRRAELVLELFAGEVRELFASATAPVTDVLDIGVRTERTVEELRGRASSISKAWNIVTALHPEDFARALEAARAGDP